MTRQRRRVRELFEEALDRDSADIPAWLGDRGGRRARGRGGGAVAARAHTRAGSFSRAVAGRVAELFEEDVPLRAGTVLGTTRSSASSDAVAWAGLSGDGCELRRTVALKALPPSLTRDQPARTAAPRSPGRSRADAPGICTVYALEELTAICSSWRSTSTATPCARRSPRGGARRRRLVSMARQIAEALASAHAKGITHRDLKPENMMRASNGRLKILDFGLALIDPARPAWTRCRGSPCLAR